MSNISWASTLQKEPFYTTSVQRRAPSDPARQMVRRCAVVLEWLIETQLLKIGSKNCFELYILFGMDDLVVPDFMGCTPCYFLYPRSFVDHQRIHTSSG